MPRAITDFLDEAVKSNPDKVAFIEEKRSITYRGLQDEAFKIAMPMVLKGYHKESVAIYLDREISAIAAMLAVAYSGNFYSMIDIEMPMERIKKIFEVLEPEVLITDKKQLEKARNLIDDNKIVVIDELSDSDVEIDSIQACRASVLESDILYVLFTSGSTGIPKGVVTPHRAVINYIISLTNAYKVDENTIMGNQVPFYFVMSVLDVYGTIAKKAQTYIIPKMNFLFPGRVVKYLYENHINFISWVPSALCLIANTNAFTAADLSGVKSVIFGGEVMPIKQLKAWQKAVPNAMFVNGYGSTEITDGCTYYIVDREFDDGDTLPIGIPFSNTSILVIDDDGNPISDGIGELCIRSDSMTYGYYKDPAKTAEVYIQNPLNKSYPEIVYKMGDLVRFNQFGELEYVGRKDHQIKHMGHRIELGEIEANINSLADVIESCCVYDKKLQQIVLFYVGDISEEDMRNMIKKILPDYMQPKRRIKLEKMPHSQNGKIDRKLLANSISEGE